MEKRVLFAAMLSAVFLAWYAQILTKGAGPIARRPLPPGTQQPPPPLEQVAPPRLVDEDVTVIGSENLRLEIGTQSGAIRKAVLPTFTDSSGVPGLAFQHAEIPIVGISVGNGPLRWRPHEHSQNSCILKSEDQNNKSYYISYTLSASNYLVGIKLNTDIANVLNPIKLSMTWMRADVLGNRNNPLEIIVLTQSNTNNKISYSRYISQGKTLRHVPRGTLISSLAERYFCLSLKPEFGKVAVDILPSPPELVSTQAQGNFESKAGGAVYAAQVYLGPRDYFHMRNAGFESAFHVGALGKLGLILLLVLSRIAAVTKNYGIAIILLSIGISFLTAPFTMIGLRSMKKLQALKPKMDRIMAQHKGDSEKANREIFALYKEHRVSPLSGCLPMLLQMPIFIALFQAISHFIELRGRTFLWVRDLSMPDRLAQLPFSLPILGQELNILPMIMAAAMYVQTKMSQPAVPAENNPTSKMMSGPLFSVIFGVMFYHFPAGLVLYWLTNSLMSLTIYKLAGRGT